MKTRQNVRTEDSNDQMIQQLRERAEAGAGLRYHHGLVRGNYVSSDERFNTTVYGEHLHASREALQAHIAVSQRLATLNLLLQHLERLWRDAPCLCKQDAVEVRNDRSFVTLLLRPAEVRPIHLCLSRVLRILGRQKTSLPGIQ